MPVFVGDTLELVVESVVGTEVLTTVALVESMLGEEVVVVESLVVLWEVSVLAVLWEVLVTGARLEVSELSNEEDELVEAALDTLDDEVVISETELETTEFGSEDVELVAVGALETPGGDVVSVVPDVGFGVAALDVSPVVSRLVGTWDGWMGDDSLLLVEDAGTEYCPEEVGAEGELCVCGGGTTMVSELEELVYEIVTAGADGENIDVVSGLFDSQGKVVVIVELGGWGIMTTVWETVVTTVDTKPDRELDDGSKYPVVPEGSSAE
jgi:hypothetical protein